MEACGLRDLTGLKNQQGFDVYGMGLALEEARKAYSLGEVPVGAVILKEGTVIGKGHNLKAVSYTHLDVYKRQSLH